MNEDRERHAGKGEPANDQMQTPWVHVSGFPGDRLDIDAILEIDGRRAELSLPLWLDPAIPTQDRHPIAREEVRRVLSLFLKGLEPS